MTEVDALRFSQEHAELLRARANARSFDAHLHATYSVVVLKTGRAHVRSARWSGMVGAGDIFFFNPYEVHAANSDDESVAYETLYPSEDLLRASIGAEASGPITIQTGILSGSRAAGDLVDLLSGGEAGGSALQDILGKLLRRCTYAVDAPALPPAAIARRACAIIADNGLRPIRTEDLARAIGVHKSHFVRAFTAAIGLAPQTYLRQVRIARARELIHAGEGLSEVAQTLGFCDQAHFAREFKKVFGVPPGAMSRDIGPKRTTQ
jgi:AraC-like DNA-binding protein